MLDPAPFLSTATKENDDIIQGSVTYHMLPIKKYSHTPQSQLSSDIKSVDQTIKSAAISDSLDSLSSLSAFDVWVSREHSTYRWLLIVILSSCAFSSFLISLRVGFYSASDITSSVSWLSFMGSSLLASAILYIPGIMSYHYGVVLTTPDVPPSQDMTLGATDDIPSTSLNNNILNRGIGTLSTSQWWPRSFTSSFFLSLLLSFAISQIYVCVELWSRLTGSVPTKDAEWPLSTSTLWLVEAAIVKPLQFILVRINPNFKEKRIGNIHRLSLDISHVISEGNGMWQTTPYDRAQRFPLSRPILCCYIYLASLASFSAILSILTPIDSPIAVGTQLVLCASHFLAIPFAAIYSLTAKSQREGESTQYADLSYTLLITFVSDALRLLLTGFVRQFLVDIKQSEADANLFTTLLSTGFYIVMTIFMYATRVASRRALSRGASLVLIASWQFYEDVFADLIFLSLDPFEPTFFILALIHCIKTIFRDLDTPASIALWCRYGRSTRDEYTQSIQRWHREFDRILLRHQNFICELAAKTVVITILLSDYIFADRDNYTYSPNLTPAICTPIQAQTWTSNKVFPLCLPLCSDLPVLPYPTLSEYVGLACYPHFLSLDDVPPQLHVDHGKRLLLVYAMLFLVGMQTLTHFGLLIALEIARRAERKNFNNHPLTNIILNSNAVDHYYDGQTEQDQDQTERETGVSIVTELVLAPGVLSNHWSIYYWYLICTFVMYIPMIFFEVRAASYLTFPDHRLLL